MSLTNAIAQQSAGMGDLSLNRDMRNMERDIKLRERQYELQKMANENKAALTSQLVGSTLGLAKGAYGAYQDHEHENAVNKSLASRRYFPEGPEGDKQFYASVGNRQGRGVMEDVFLRSRMPQVGSVSAYMTRQGLIDKDAEEQMRRESWLDSMMDIYNNTPRF